MVGVQLEGFAAVHPRGGNVPHGPLVLAHQRETVRSGPFGTRTDELLGVLGPSRPDEQLDVLAGQVVFLGLGADEGDGLIITFETSEDA